MYNNFEKKVMTIQGKGILPYHTLSVKDVCTFSLEARKLPCVNALGKLFGMTTYQIIRSGEKMVVTNYGTCSRKGFL
jgi:hypothetical protein